MLFVYTWISYVRGSVVVMVLIAGWALRETAARWLVTPVMVGVMLMVDLVACEWWKRRRATALQWAWDQGVKEPHSFVAAFSGGGRWWW